MHTLTKSINLFSLHNEVKAVKENCPSACSLTQLAHLLPSVTDGLMVSKIMQKGVHAVYGVTYAMLGVYSLSADCMLCVGGRSV